MNLEIRHLRQFVTVAEELHFTRAADLLHIAQPALSAQIKRLEAKLEVRLFDRSTRQVRLTPEGERLYRAAKLTLEHWENTLTLAASLRRGETGHASLGVSLRITSRVRAEIQRQLVRINPDVTVDFVAENTTRLVEEVLAGRVDAALCLAPVHHPGVRSQLVRHDRMLAALPTSHVLAARETVSLVELKAEQWIVPNRGVGSAALLEAMCLAVGFEMQTAKTTSADYDDEFTAVAQGLGFEAVPGSIVPLRSVDGVTFIPIDDISLPLELLYRAESVSAPLATVIEAIMQSQGDSSKSVHAPRAADTITH